MPSAVTIRDAEGGELVRNQRAEEIQRRAAGDADAETWFRAASGTPRRTGSPPSRATGRTSARCATARSSRARSTSSSATTGRGGSCASALRRSATSATGSSPPSASSTTRPTSTATSARCAGWPRSGACSTARTPSRRASRRSWSCSSRELADAGLDLPRAVPTGRSHLRRVVVGEDGGDEESLLTLPERERSLPADHPAVLCTAGRGTLEVVRDAARRRRRVARRAGLRARRCSSRSSTRQHNHGCLALATAGPGTQDPRDVKVLELDRAAHRARAREQPALRRAAPGGDGAPARPAPGRPAGLARPGARHAAPPRPRRRRRRRRLLRPVRRRATSGCSIVGDVSGKGVEAAATTALVRHAVRVAARTEQPAHAAGSRPSTRPSLEDAPGDQFCTLAWAALQARRRRGRSARSPAPGTRSRSSSAPAAASSPSRRRARCSGSSTTCGRAPRQVRLAPGDALVLFTDGVTEARLPDGSLFGADRVRDAARHGGATGRPTACSTRSRERSTPRAPRPATTSRSSSDGCPPDGVPAHGRPPLDHGVPRSRSPASSTSRARPSSRPSCCGASPTRPAGRSSWTCAPVTFIDSSGLRSLLRRRARGDARAGSRLQRASRGPGRCCASSSSRTSPTA